MDTTLRSKAMEKESLTSKFLLNRCNLSLILVQYMLVSVQYMREAFFAANPFSLLSMIRSRMFLEEEEVEIRQN